MPSVARMPVTIAAADQPDIAFVGVAVASNGDIAYVSSRVVAPIIRVVDSTGRLVEPIGRLGDGPGEFRTPSRLWIRGDTLVAISRADVFAQYLLSGRFVHEWHSRLIDVSLDLVGDSVDHYDPTRPLSGRPVQVRRVALGGGGDHAILPGSDSLIASALRGSRLSNIGFTLPYSSRSGRIFLGDGYTWRIRVYDETGHFLYQIHRALPPRYRGPRELAVAQAELRQMAGFRGPAGQRAPPVTASDIAALAREPMPWFGKTPFFVDGKGRLWVFGTARDSTVADVFADSTYLGHVTFPCYNPYGFRSMSGHWIAMNCDLEDDAPLPFELQLYRIVEPVAGDSGKPGAR